MNRSFASKRWLALIVLASAGLLALAPMAQISQAQDEKKGKAPAKAPGKAGNAVEPPSGLVFDRTVEALLASNPKSPTQLMQTIKLLIGLKHPQYAKQYMGPLLAHNLDEAALANLVNEFGSGPFLQMIMTPELLPEGKDFAEKALAAARAQAVNPERLATLVAQLDNPGHDVRDTAALQMRSAGTLAIAPLVKTLADPAQAKVHKYVRTALVMQGQVITYPLIGAIETSDAALKAQLIEVLARLNDERATPFLIWPALDPKSDPAVKAAADQAMVHLLGKVPSVAEGVFLLRTKAATYLEHFVPLDTDLEGQVEVWHWDDAKKESVAVRVPADAAYATYAARLAGDAHHLSPEDAKVRRLYLTALLQAGMLSAGLDATVDGAMKDEAKRLGIEPLMEVVEQSLDGKNVPAAIAAAQLIGEMGDSKLLHQYTPRVSPLVAAALHKDRRLRLAAAEAVVKLKPTEPYPGASNVMESLGFFVATLGAPRAIVTDPRIPEARRMASLLNGMGFESEVAGSEYECFKLASARSDVELILLSATMGRLELELTIRRLRNDGRMAGLPIGIVYSPVNPELPNSMAELQLARQMSVGDPLTALIVRPDDVKGMEIQVKLLLQQLGRAAQSGEIRKKQSLRAIELLAELSQQLGQLRDARRAVLAGKQAAPAADIEFAWIYNIRRLEGALKLALFVPELSPKAAQALGDVATPSGQVALVELASLGTQKLELRKAAAEAFAASVARWGTLLTTVEIKRQYDRYNDSETADKDTQAVLASILDAIEAKAGRVVEADPPPAEK